MSQPSPRSPDNLCRWRGAVVVERRTRASSTTRWIGARGCLLALVASSTQSSAASSVARYLRVALVTWLTLCPDLRPLRTRQGLRVWTARLTTAAVLQALFFFSREEPGSNLVLLCHVSAFRPDYRQILDIYVEVHDALSSRYFNASYRVDTASKVLPCLGVCVERGTAVCSSRTSRKYGG